MNTDPLTGRLNANTDTRVMWTDRLFPYIAASRSKSVYICPGNIARVEASRFKGIEVSPWGFHYDMNAFGVGMGPALGLSPFVTVNGVAIFKSSKESDIVFPSEMIAYGDSVPGYHFCEFSHLAFFGSPNSGPAGAETQQSENVISRRHNGRWNVVFVDGHTETHRTKALFGSGKRVPVEEAMRRRWNRDHLPHWEELR